jgi:exodeoxyribonuclease VIII
MKTVNYSEWDGSFPAIVLDMPIEEYHNHDSISNSGLSLVSRSPAHYAFASPWSSTRAKEIGTAFHTALLEPERFEEEYFITEETVRTKVAYKDAAAKFGGDKTLTKNEGESVKVMLESIRSNPSALELFEKEGFAEVSFFWIDKETGSRCRCRFDWLTVDGEAVDLKKTQDCREYAFSKSLHAYRYHCQAAMYRDGFEQTVGEPLKSFQILAVEENPPCANILYDIDALALEYGYQEFVQALKIFALCKKTENWYSYSGTGVVSLPEYVLSTYENENEVLS